ncbi:YkoP family protein [Cohnella mopanensis]|uniref:YkoP family protein n=1 Tax=Cohnella mopanensis TaxID=2911966 RepID=UPI001EF84239|nr:polysaccharide deacetylase [Cohnella mopanensis]
MNNQPNLASRMGRSTRARAFNPTRISGLTARQKLWLAWEKAAGRMMESMSESVLEAGMCKILVKKYKGEDILCADGTRIVKGDRVGELHLNNRMVLELTADVGANRAAIQTARLVRSSLKEINEALETRTDLSRVKALVGVTLLHRGLTHGLGFEIRSLPSKRFERVTALYLKLLLGCMHPDGLRRIEQNKDKLTPQLLILSRDALSHKFSFIKSSLFSREVPKDCSL